jgi:hypothetical protein
MKRFLLFIMMISLLMNVFSQQVTQIFTYPNATTPFGQTIPQGSIVINQSYPTSFYRISYSQPSTRTLAQAVGIGQAIPIPDLGYFKFNQNKMSNSTAQEALDINSTGLVIGAGFNKITLPSLSTADIIAYGNQSPSTKRYNDSTLLAKIDSLAGTFPDTIPAGGDSLWSVSADTNFVKPILNKGMEAEQIKVANLVSPNLYPTYYAAWNPDDSLLTSMPIKRYDFNMFLNASVPPLYWTSIINSALTWGQLTGNKTFVVSDTLAINGAISVPDGFTLVFQDGGFLWDPTNTASVSGSNVRIISGDQMVFDKNIEVTGTYLADFPYATWFGAVGDSLTDDYQSLNRFFDFLENCSYSTAYFSPEKKYRISDELDKDYTKDLSVDGQRATIYYAYYEIADETSESAYVVTLENPSLYTKDLAADIASGSSSVTLNNVTGLSAGMYIKILSSETWRTEKVLIASPYTVTKYLKGFISKIIGISGTTVTLADPVPFSMSSSGSYNQYVYCFEPNKLEVKNLNIVAVGTLPTEDLRLNMLKVNNLFDSEISNCMFSGGYYGLNITGSYNSLIKDIIVPLTADNEKHSTGRYGIGVTLGCNTYFDNLHMMTNGHCFTLTGEPSYNVRIKNSYLHQVNSEGSHSIDSHSSYSVFVENTTFWGTWWNFGKIIFNNCQVYSDAGQIFDYRIGFKSDLDLTFNDCDIYFDSTYTSESYLLRPETSSGYYASESFATVNITNNRIYNPRSAVVLFQERNLYSDAIGGGTLNITGNTFKGTTVRLTRNYTASATATRGKVVFKNNIYDNLVMDGDLNYELFSDYSIENNTPRNPSSTFDIDLAGYSTLSFTFKNNMIQGAPVNITSNTQGLTFINNVVSSGSVSTITGNTVSIVDFNRWATTPTISGSSLDLTSDLSMNGNFELGALHDVEQTILDHSDSLEVIYDTVNQIKSRVDRPTKMTLFYNAGQTVTSQPSAERFYGNSSKNMILLDLSGYTQVRMVTRVTTASASANSPRYTVKYRTTYDASISNFIDIGTSEVSTSLTSTGLISSGWINLATEAKANDVYVILSEVGGDASASPITGIVMLYFK